MTVRRAPSESVALNTSKRPCAAVAVSGTRKGTSTSSSAIAGRLMRNTEPHQKCSRSSPLTTGPREMPAVMTPVQRVTAFARCFASWKRLRISARVEGIRAAPPIPSNARTAMSTSADCAYAAATEAAPNTAAPARTRARRPMRSPREPMTMSRPASTKPYMSRIHNCCVALGSRSWLMNGMAK